MSSYFRLRHSRSMNTLSIHRPRPSIEMRIPEAASVPVKAALVNWLPWSVLKMSGRPKRASASSSAETQNDTSAKSAPPGRNDILVHAYAQCRSNKGAPGVDGQDFADIEAYGVQRWLGELALALRQETYRPDPIRIVSGGLLTEGDRVEYVIGQCPKTGRDEAQNVRILARTSS